MLTFLPRRDVGNKPDQKPASNKKPSTIKINTPELIPALYEAMAAANKVSIRTSRSIIFITTLSFYYKFQRTETLNNAH